MLTLYLLFLFKKFENTVVVLFQEQFILMLIFQLIKVGLEYYKHYLNKLVSIKEFIKRVITLLVIFLSILFIQNCSYILNSLN